jgi:hypothetical protein
MAPGFGSFLRRVVGGTQGRKPAEPQADEPIDYNGYKIHPAPRHQGSNWIVAGTITKAEEGDTREYRFIRADSHSSRDGAVELTVIKAKQIIDLEGDRMFENASKNR